MGVDSPAGQALIAQFAPPVAPPAPAVDPFAGQPPHVKMAVDAVGGYDSPAGKDMFGKLTGQTVAPIAPAPVAAAPVAPPPLVVNPTPVAAPAASAPTVGFGSTVPAATPPQTPTAQVTASGASLAEILKKKLGIAAGPATVQ